VECAYGTDLYGVTAEKLEIEGYEGKIKLAKTFLYYLNKF